ncbi:MAG: endolytic transglycosylase MltG [Treponema sp.]|nr:endolytic transglycosylase MltG [Treponema sp.]
MNKTKKIIILILSLLLLFVISSFTITVISVSPLSSNSTSIQKRIEVPSGTSVKEISYKLKAENLIRSQLAFYLLARFPSVRTFVLGTNINFNLKSGVYQISPSMNLSEIFQVLSSGKQEYIKVSIPEGLTISKIAQKLESRGVCKAQDFILISKDKDLLSEYNINAENFEGYLFPDTYFFTPMMQAEECLSLMADNFFEKIKSIEGYQGLSSEELHYFVTLASIIEREYRIKEEAPLIASVFKNRLAHNIGLYSCATIEYILTEIQGKDHPDVITYADLAIDNPYNTYKWAGLPPGPISNPGITALSAAKNPADTNFYYFRLVNPEEGRHSFSKDFSTHITEGYIYNTKKSSK